ncbi:hypothetical protein ATO4_07765 [Aurantimonas sp. 22II-16-19i]|nr:hypothetical protein ATO4_07765 [Aurantimonas sp. 22II-16-19i]
MMVTGSLAMLVAMLPGPTFGQDASVAALFPPWWPQERVLRAATSAGDLVDSGGWTSVVVLRFGDSRLPDRLREAGALIVLDAGSLGCFTTSPQEEEKIWTELRISNGTAPD